MIHIIHTTPFVGWHDTPSREFLKPNPWQGIVVGDVFWKSGNHIFVYLIIRNGVSVLARVLESRWYHASFHLASSSVTQSGLALNPQPIADENGNKTKWQVHICPMVITMATCSFKNDSLSRALSLSVEKVSSKLKTLLAAVFMASAQSDCVHKSSSSARSQVERSWLWWPGPRRPRPITSNRRSRARLSDGNRIFHGRESFWGGSATRAIGEGDAVSVNSISGRLVWGFLYLSGGEGEGQSRWGRWAPLSDQVSNSQ